MNGKNKKILTLDDLVKFCQENGLAKFSSEESNYKLHVQVPAYFEKKESDDNTLYADVRIMHIGKNVNGSSLTENGAKHCMRTLAYKPVLANFTDVNGEWDFTSHDFTVSKDENGNEVIEYQEKQVGCFTSDKPYIEYNKEYDRDFIYGRVAIPREYTKAAEIIERKGETKVSAELCIYEMSFSAKDNVLVLEDAELTGLTLLGVDPNTGKEIGEGMRGSKLSIESFNEDNNSVFSKDLVTELRKFNENFEALKINNELGGKNIVNKFEELLAKYNKVAEDIEFEYDGLSDEELEKKFEEAFKEESNEGSDDGASAEAVTLENESDGETSNDVEASDNSKDNSEESESNDDSSNENEDDNSISQDFSVTTPNGVTKNFSLSLDDISHALYQLVNDTYSELDNDCYSVSVYPDDAKVVFYGWFSENAYRQSYKRKKDNFSLEGERVRVYSEWLSEDEKKALDNMKANYSSIEDKLAKYESEPEKLEILNSDDYAGIKNTKEYTEISKRENYFELSKDELSKKLDEITLSYAKSQKLDFSSKTNKNEGKPKISIKPLFGGSVGNTGRYGGVFSKR